MSTCADVTPNRHESIRIQATDGITVFLPYRSVIYSLLDAQQQLLCIEAPKLLIQIHGTNLAELAKWISEEKASAVHPSKDGKERSEHDPVVTSITIEEIKGK